jgi:hypothetical protein
MKSAITVGKAAPALVRVSNLAQALEKAARCRKSSACTTWPPALSF